jgi:predicted AlkP superfamily phosphohydrolase/phosphomutase
VTETIVLGLDGATWGILEPLVEAGELPNIAALRETGNGGSLESTVPPVTAPAWLSMATGRNPGKTGVFYFFRRDSPDSYEFSPVDASDFRGWSVWDYLSANGESVGVFNVPLLHPPYEVDGYVVSGIGAPGDGPHATPPELAEELDTVTGGYELKVPYASPEYEGRPGALVDDLQRVLGKRATAIEHLLETRPTDHFFGVVSATDWAQHYLWPDHDTSHPLHDPESPHQDALTDIWRQVDELVGRVRAIADQRDAHLLLVSDHGFGPTERTFNVTEWLEREGLLVRPQQSPVGRLRNRYFPYLRRAGETVARAIPQLSDMLERVGRGLRGDQHADIDFERSVAFAPRQNLGVGLLYLLSDDESTRRSIESGLEDVAAAEEMDITLQDPSELYCGEATGLAPDIVFTMDDLACAVDARRKPDAELVERGPPSRARSANHRMEGFYLLAGPGVDAETAGQPRDLLDIAPTLLFVHDRPIPEEMDGCVMQGAFTPEFVADHRLRRVSEPRRDRREAEEDGDVRELHQQLGELGYR